MTSIVLHLLFFKLTFNLLYNIASFQNSADDKICLVIVMLTKFSAVVDMTIRNVLNQKKN